MTLYVNIIGSGRNEGYNLPAYIDVAIRGKIDWPRDGSVHRIHLPRAIFKRTHCWKKEVG